MISKKLASLLAHGLVQQSLSLSYFAYSTASLFSEEYKEYSSEKARDLKVTALCAFLTFLVGLWHTVGSFYQLIPLIRPTYWVRIISSLLFLAVTRLENNIWKWFAILQLLGGIWSALLGAVKREPHKWPVSQKWSLEWRVHLITAASIFVSSLILLLLMLSGGGNIQLFGTVIPNCASFAWLLVQCGMLGFYQIVASRYRLAELLSIGAMSLISVVALLLLFPPVLRNPVVVSGLLTWASLALAFYYRRVTTAKGTINSANTR